LPLGNLGKMLWLSETTEDGNSPLRSLQDRQVAHQDTPSLLKPRETAEDTNCSTNFVELVKQLQSAQEKSPDGQPPEDRAYRPIVLKNCDQVIPNLYLGGVDAVADSQRVSSQGIKAICCCLREMEYPSNEFCKDVEYYRVDVEDMGREPIEMYFPEATDFIHSWISREQPVLVHCRAGVSRSASVIIAYLMTYQGYSLHEAFFVVKSHRSVITPNVGFMEKLCNFEEERQSRSPTIDMNKYESWYTSSERGAVPDLIPD